MKHRVIACIVTSLLLQPSVGLADEGMQWDWPAGIASRAELPDDPSLEYEFVDLEIDQIQRWLGWIGLQLPVDIRGRVSGWLWAKQSERGWWNLRDYRLEAQLRSPDLQIDQWQVEQAVLRFGYAGNAWYLGRLAGNVRPVGSPQAAAAALLQGQLSLDGTQQLQLAGGLMNVDLQALLQPFNFPVAISNKGGSLQLQASVPRASMLDIESWSGHAQFELEQVQIPALPAGEAKLDMQLEAGQWKLRQGAILVGTQPLKLDAQGELAASWPFSLSLSGEDLELISLLTADRWPAGDLPLTGKVNLSANAAGNALQGLQTLHADLSSSTLHVLEQPLQDVTIVARYQPENSQFRLDIGRFANGSLSAACNWKDLDPRQNPWPQSASLQISDLNLQSLNPRLNAFSFSGVTSGEFSVTTQPDPAMGESIRWATEGTLRAEAFAAMGMNIGDTSLRLNKRQSSDALGCELRGGDGSLRSDFEVRLRSASPTGLQHTLASQYVAKGSLTDFRTRLRLDEEPATVVPILLSGQFRIRGQPEQWLQSGTMELDRAALRVEDQWIQVSTAALQVTPEEFRLSRFQVLDPRGRIAGSGIFRRTTEGLHLLNLRIVDLESGPYLRNLLPPALRDTQTRLSLELGLSKQAAVPSWMDGWTGRFRGRLDEILLRSVPVGALDLQGQLEDQWLAAELRGTLLGGETQLDLKAKPEVVMPLVTPAAETEGYTLAAPSNRKETPPLSVQLDWKGIRLERLLALGIGESEAASFAGLADLKASGALNSSGDLQVLSEISIPSLQRQSVNLAKNLLIELDYGDDRLEIRKLRGEVAQGRINARGELEMEMSGNGMDLGRGLLVFDASRIQIDQLIPIFQPDIANQFSGSASYRGRIDLAREIIFSGTAQISDARVYGLPIQNALGQVRLRLAKDGSVWELSSRDLRGQAVGGVLAGQFNVRRGARFKLNASASIGNGKLEQLSRALGFERIVGSGRFDAASQLVSEDALSMNALSGSARMRFAGGDVRAVPILSDLSRYVPLLQFASTEITEGNMHATIGGGQISIQDLFLNSNAFWLVANGKAGLVSGRLDLNALLQTGGGLDQQLVQSGLELAALAIVPEAVLFAQINDLIQNRSLYFRIRGTTSRPVIQAKLAETLGKALVQQVRRQFLIAPVPSVNWLEN